MKDKEEELKDKEEELKEKEEEDGGDERGRWRT